MRSVDVIGASAGVAADMWRWPRTTYFGIDGELSDDEGCEEEQSWFDCAGSARVTLTGRRPHSCPDEDELAFALGERGVQRENRTDALGWPVGRKRSAGHVMSRRRTKRLPAAAKARP